MRPASTSSSDDLPTSLEELSAELARLWREAGRPTPRIREIVRAMVRDFPSEPWPHLALAEVLSADGAGHDAVRSIQRAVALAPDDRDYALSAAEELVTLGRPDLATEQLDRVAVSGVGEAERVPFGRKLGIEGRVCESEGDAVEAETLMRRALQVLPEYEFHWYALGALLLRQGRVTEAERVVREGLSRFPDDLPLKELARGFESAPPPGSRTRSSGSSTGTSSSVTWWHTRG